MATFIRNNNLFCDKCGGEFTIKYPIGIKEMVEKTNSFETLHKDCEQTYEETKIDMSKEILDRAYQWVAIGETGLSSKTMWNCFMSVERGYPINIPHDPDDFSRCYKLLEALPEWKSQISKLKRLSPEWDRLVDNWDELTKMWEKKDADMYKYMRKLIDN
jgi:hypothetical protein